MIRTLRSLMLPLQAAPGLLSCHLFVDVSDANSICYEEIWQSTEELDRQIRSSHYDQLLSVMELAAQAPELRLSWISLTKGVEYLEMVRHVAQ